MSPSGSQQYKVKLTSGRILGPIDLDRVRALILKNQIDGKEVARLYPEGDWHDINSIPEIALLLVEHARGSLTKEGDPSHVSSYQPILGNRNVDAGATQIVSVPAPQLSKGEAAGPLQAIPINGAKQTIVESADDKTLVGVLENDAEDATRAMESPGTKLEIESHRSLEIDSPEPPEYQQERTSAVVRRQIAQEPTVMFQAGGNKGFFSRFTRGRSIKNPKVKQALVVIFIVAMGIEIFSEDPKPPGAEFTTVASPRAVLPVALPNADPAKSESLYTSAINFYLLDHVVGYRKSVNLLQQAAADDINNVKALALLASSYLNLIDASNKDENYFAVISKLIDLTKAAKVDLPETVIADVEFFITVNKPEAAQSRILEYTKAHPNFGLEMLYYFALCLYERGNYDEASNYLRKIPDSKIFSAKIFYLHGQIAEKQGNIQEALSEYSKAIQFNPDHAKSRLRIASLENDQGKLKEAAPQLEFLTNHPQLMAPRDLSQAYYLHGLFSEVERKYNVALIDLERAVRLDRDNHDYLLELYTLRAKQGGNVSSGKKEARMYYFLGEGERLVKESKYQDALVQFLQSREANNTSPLPLIKIGDMFSRLHELPNALINYREAFERAPENIAIASKYMDVLIESYEWTEAEKVMARFRNLPVNQSAVDKAAADMYQKQGRFIEAQAYYRKAMGRNTIDPTVYLAYANSLYSVKDYKDAPFFYALALRFDPLNTDALIGNAKCIAETDRIERAVEVLEDEVKRGTADRAELLSAIADFQIQIGDWKHAQENINQAKSLNPELALPWRLQAKIDISQEGTDRHAIDHALASYKSYSDRNASDPSGYLERYRLFIRRSEYEKAGEELNRIYSLYPKYPNLHFFRGALYSVQGNHKVAIDEYKAELALNAASVPALIALGKEYLETGAGNDALGLFTRAMSISPKSAEAKEQAGYANYLLKNYSASVALYNTALSIDSGNPTLYKRLGVAYAAMGDNQNASLAFHKYLQMEPDAPDRAEFERFR